MVFFYFFFLSFFLFEKFVSVTASPGFLTPSVTLKITPASSAVILYQDSFLKFFLCLENIQEKY